MQLQHERGSAGFASALLLVRDRPWRNGPKKEGRKKEERKTETQDAAGDDTAQTRDANRESAAGYLSMTARGYYCE